MPPAKIFHVESGAKNGTKIDYVNVYCIGRDIHNNAPFIEGMKL